MERFAGLRPKMYSYDVNGKCHKRIKGVKEYCHRHITTQNIIDILDGKMTNEYGTMRIFRSRGHTIHTESINKLILDGKDSKRIILSDNIHTLPFGYEI